jgi:hypothetical protein
MSTVENPSPRKLAQWIPFHAAFKSEEKMGVSLKGSKETDIKNTNNHPYQIRHPRRCEPVNSRTIDEYI